jgi:hypothetical protein
MHGRLSRRTISANLAYSRDQVVSVAIERRGDQLYESRKPPVGRIASGSCIVVFCGRVDDAGP